MELTQRRAEFTKRLIDVFKERTSPTGFLRSFFENKQSNTKDVSIEVQRGTVKIAADVQRGSNGNRNEGGRFTEKVIIPPYFREYFEATDLRTYDLVLGAIGSDNAKLFVQLMDEVAEELGMLVDKIDRAKELQCAQVLETGVVTMVNGDNINYQRKAGSLIDNSGTPWSAATTNPMTQVAEAIKFIREEGKAQGSTYNLILGSDAKAALTSNEIFVAEADVRRIDTMDIREPQRNAVGATSHGYFSAGDYRVNIWTYPEFYETDAGVKTYYLNPKKAIVLPENPRFIFAHAAVPQLINGTSAPEAAAYVFGEYMDERQASHVYDVKSAGVPVPVGIDQMATMEVLA